MCEYCISAVDKDGHKFVIPSYKISDLGQRDTFDSYPRWKLDRFDL